MTHYYFDIQQDAFSYRDEFGIDLIDLAEVRDQVIALLPDMAKDAKWYEDHHRIRCQVRDCVDDIVYEGELTFTGRTMKETA